LPTSSDPAGEFAIRARGLGKRYRIATRGRRHDTLRDALTNSVRGVFQRRPRDEAGSFWALKDVGFDIRPGENVGVLGLNGAGKSTLLKVLSRVTTPTAGEAQIEGRLGSLLEVGTGFHGELSGRENVFLYGAILGMGRAEIAAKFDAIVAFAEVEEFIDTPVKRYSSGMYVRLAFSVAAHLEPDILLLDEVLSVGDLPFQRKCIEFAKGLQRRQATILFVSHNMFSIKTMCDRVIYLRHGQVQFDGPTEQGIALYEADCRLSAAPWARYAGLDDAAIPPIAITDVALTDAGGAPRSVFDHGERLRLRIDYEVNSPVAEPNFIVALVRSDGVACCNWSSALDGAHFEARPGGGRIELLSPPLSLVSELYRIEILVREKGFQRLVCAQVGGSLHVRHPLFDTHFGVFHEPAEWTFTAEPLAAAPRPRAVEAEL
jgi:lipopolysaccharide transport system ATP-binding protein